MDKTKFFEDMKREKPGEKLKKRGSSIGRESRPPAQMPTWRKKQKKIPIVRGIC